jgi:hypothetical protein
MTAVKTNTQSSTSDPYYSQHDIAVAQRLAEAQGFGEPLYYNDDDDLAGVIQDLGVRDG